MDQSPRHVTSASRVEGHPSVGTATVLMGDGTLVNNDDLSRHD